MGRVLCFSHLKAPSVSGYRSETHVGKATRTAGTQHRALA